MQSSKTLCTEIPRLYDDNHSLTRRKLFLKDDLFYDNVEGNRKMIDIYRVRFYSCMRLKNLLVS